MTVAKNAPLTRIRKLLKAHGCRRVGDDWTCPSHDDGDPSLTVKAGEVHPVVLHCHAGCKPESVLAALGSSWAEVLDSNPKAVVAKKPYLYVDEDGTVLYRVQRWTYADGSKTFRQHRSKPNGGWTKKRGDVRQVLWNLPQLLEAISDDYTIHLTEGEKDAEALNAYFEEHDLAEFATCHAGGAGKWVGKGREKGYLKSLRGAPHVVVWGDRDTAGYRDALRRFSSVSGVGLDAEVRLPIPEEAGADVHDHLDAEHKPKDGVVVSADGIQELLGESEEDELVLEAIQDMFLASEDKASDHLADVHSDADVLAMEDPQYVIEDWVPRGLYTVLFGPPGVGKTFALLGMSRAVRRGTRWQDHATEKGAVLFYQGEGLSQLKPRIKEWDARYPKKPMRPGGSLDRFVDLTKPEGVAAVVRTVRAFEKRDRCKVAMVVIDPLVEFMTGEENGPGMDLVTRGLRALASYLDIAVVVGHHTNASGERARGADFHRMRAGAFIQMEALSEGEVGLWQQKQKNGERVAVILEPVEHEGSLVLEWRDNLPVSSYVMLKESGKKREKNETRMKVDAARRKEAAAALEAIVGENPKISQRKLLTKGKEHGFGNDFLVEVLDELTDPTSVGTIRIERGPRNAKFHYLVDAE